MPHVQSRNGVNHHKVTVGRALKPATLMFLPMTTETIREREAKIFSRTKMKSFLCQSFNSYELCQHFALHSVALAVTT